MIIRPDGHPAKRKQETLSRDEVRRVVEFEQWCQARGLHIDLYCDKCVESFGPRGSRCWGNNPRDATTYHLECQCTDRVYGNAQSPRREIPKAAPAKIQVMVPGPGTPQ